MKYFYLIISSILFGGVVFGAQVLADMGAGLFEIMLYPNLIPVILFFYPARKDMRLALGLPLRQTLLLIAAMFFVTIGEYAPLFFKVPVSVVVLLLYLQPVWTLLISRFYFHEPVSGREWFLALVMIAGLVVLINPFADFRFSLSGITLAVLGGIGLSLWVFITRYFSEKNINPWTTFWICCVYSIIPIVILYVGLLEYNLLPGMAFFSDAITPRLWAAFVFYALIVITLPNILIFYNNKDIPAPVIGMILLLEPVTGIILDVLFLGTLLSWNIIIGGLMILCANLALIFKK